MTRHSPVQQVIGGTLRFFALTVGENAVLEIMARFLPAFMELLHFGGA